MERILKAKDIHVYFWFIPDVFPLDGKIKITQHIARHLMILHIKQKSCGEMYLRPKPSRVHFQSIALGPGEDWNILCNVLKYPITPSAEA